MSNKMYWTVSRIACIALLLMGEGYVRAQSSETESQGRTEAVLASQYRGQVEAIKQEFAQAGFLNVHFQFMRKGQPPPNIGVGPQVPAGKARQAIRLALKYNQDIKILLPSRLFPSRFITIASSNFDDTVEFPIDKAALERLQDPSLTTEEFHDLYRRLTTAPSRASHPPDKGAVVRTAGISAVTLQEHRSLMLKNAEEMVAHGGMGDAKAIVHHCEEMSSQAVALLRGLPPGDRRTAAAIPHLQEAVSHCERVSKLGVHADPGQLLNPATKARAAAREATKYLAEVEEGGR